MTMCAKLRTATERNKEGGDKLSNFAEKLKALRGEKSTKEVSSAIGISDSALRMYELGLRVPRDEIKIKLADYYNTKVQDIFFD